MPLLSRTRSSFVTAIRRVEEETDDQEDLIIFDHQLMPCKPPLQNSFADVRPAIAPNISLGARGNIGFLEMNLHVSGLITSSLMDDETLLRYLQRFAPFPTVH